MWPFARRSGKTAKPKSPSDGPQSSSSTAAVAGLNADRKLPSAHNAVQSHVLTRSPSRRNSRRKGKRSRPTATAPSMPLPQPDRDTSVEDITALPKTMRLEQSPHLRPIAHAHAIPYNFQPNHPTHSDSQSSLPRKPRKLLRPQSLRKPPVGEQETTFLARRSSKRKAHDSVREEEIRAMSMPQKRPAGYSQGMFRRDSKKVKGGLNSHFQRPISDVSLPLADSIHSSMSGSSESRAFRVSTLDMLSPRPKIRCSVGPHHGYSSTRESPVSMKEKDNVSEEFRRTNSSGHQRRSSRIDDLADTLDAGALRQILERDKRRKEAKKKANDERLKRKLERRAEKQRAAEQWAAAHAAGEQAGPPSPPEVETPGAIGLGIQKDGPTPMEDVRPSTPQTPSQRPQHLHLSTPKRSHENAQLPTPVDSPLETPVVADAQAVRLSRASISPTPQAHTRGPSNVSELPALLSELAAQEKPIETMETVQDPRTSGSLYPVTTVDTTATSKRGSRRRRSSEGGRMAAFASFFRRAKRGSKDQGHITPSEVSFSNTSRESMSRQPLPAHLMPKQPLQPIAVKRPARPPSVPRRTMSKFREDLPESSKSPPESRVQSPDVLAPSAIASRRQSQRLSGLLVSSNSTATEARTDSPVSPGVPDTGLMSQSLASVDSEGSWLSGKPMKRRSNNAYVRSSISSSAAKRNDFNASYEELGIPDDEYFRRLTPQADDRRWSENSAECMNRKPSSAAIVAMDPAAEADDEGLPTAAASTSDEQLKTGVARQPTIVHRQPRVKSAEGLLSFYQADKSSPEEEKKTAAGEEQVQPDSPTSEGEPMILQRAQSVNLGKHDSRRLSAGSAKLLDIKARKTSADPRRSSLGSQHTLSQL
ncbi:uncharacterized protein EI97DRAFT_191732 [Westerdykella ornata]|uniref:Uncharacterized protein n=1 Tax=Westerdykella ornata TaxID=318751 RepID=A0A6A6J9A4_WESOR|nr:uncharacterized protein EI97DRAFT_191732 [Westerdykella ornata]KAF2272982.1 hypothetical protein EI97DRAFT_191732 [Westerdykella ornata]